MCLVQDVFASGSASAMAEKTSVSGAADRASSAAEKMKLRRLDMNFSRKGRMGSVWPRLVSFLGLLVMIGIAWLLSTDRSAVDWKLVGWGVALQIIFGVAILQTRIGMRIFEWLKDFFQVVLDFTNAGSTFVFGELANPAGKTGFIFAFSILPTIIFFSSFMAVLYYFGIVQVIVRLMARIMMKTMGTSGAESLSAAANVFVGQTEAPLVVKPYVEEMTVSELNALMVGGMATVAGGVMAAYVKMGISAGHLLSASVMSAPAALVIAKIMVPEKDEPVTAGEVKMDIPVVDVNVIDAAARGASEGLQLALNVGAMLLAFIALVAMGNYCVGLVHDWLALVLPPAVMAWVPASIEQLLGAVFSPIAWVMGVPWKDCVHIGSLLGIKIVLNEFVAYQQLGTMLSPSSGIHLEPRSVVIATYALCGFANFGSIAIQLGGIGGMAPSRRHDLARLGLRALIGGTLAAFMTATIAGILVV